MPKINHQKFIEFLARNKYAAEFFIKHISKSYNVVDMDLIERYADKCDLDKFSQKTPLPWSGAPIENYWDWRALSQNTSLPWSEELIERFADKWVWNELSQNNSLPWSEELLERFADKWDWEMLSINESLPWSEELLERFTDKWEWHKLSQNNSLPWSEELIERFADKWVWHKLSQNNSLPWSEELLERFADKWDWESLKESQIYSPRLNELLIECVSWTKQEISTALEKIRSAHYKPLPLRWRRKIAFLKNYKRLSKK